MRKVSYMLPIVAASIGVTSEVAAFQPVGSVVSTTMRRTIKGRTLVPLKSPGFHPSLSFTRLRQHNQKLTFLNGGGPSDEIISMAYDWTVNLGAPAALVAGAVVATMYENISSGSLSLSKNDSTYTDLAKKVARLLLLSAFILEIVCIFVTAVTGTMLLSRPMSGMKNGFGTALGFLWENFQFEYLTARITFLQGLLNWLAAIALEHTIPREGDKPATIQVNKFIASSLITLIIYMISFYNAHLAFYGNYFGMLCTYAKGVWLRFCWHWPPRILPIFALPSLLASLKYGWLVFADSFKYERNRQSKDE